jgi:hypothetical protein
MILPLWSHIPCIIEACVLRKKKEKKKKKGKGKGRAEPCMIWAWTKSHEGIMSSPTGS